MVRNLLRKPKGSGIESASPELFRTYTVDGKAVSIRIQEKREHGILFAVAKLHLILPGGWSAESHTFTKAFACVLPAEVVRIIFTHKLIRKPIFSTTEANSESEEFLPAIIAEQFVNTFIEKLPERETGIPFE